MTSTRALIQQYYEDHFFPEAAQHLDTILRGKNEELFLKRLHQTTGMKPWQLFLATEMEMAFENDWPL